MMVSLLSTMLLSQNLTQTIRGQIIDEANQLPLIGATVEIAGTEHMQGTTTDVDGSFRLENVPIGRVSLFISYLGYEPMTISNIVVNSAKEVYIETSLRESLITMEEVVITAQDAKGETLNEMALISARSISPEQTNRYAGGFNDPSRITSNFAGVTHTQDGNNDLIIRGNSPKYVQYRLEGNTITNPNHFADQSGMGGAVSALNNNLLASSDFYTGAFAPEYGNALSSVYDIRLRKGNNEKLEGVFGFGLLGTELTLEGPFKKGYKGSFLVNYRYATVGLIKNLGLIDVPGIPEYQDATFKLWLPTKNFGSFSIYGLGGWSNFLWEDVKPSTWVTPGDNSMQPNISEDYRKTANLQNLGLNHTISTGEKGYLKTSLLMSNQIIQDEVTEKRLQADSSVISLLNFVGDMDRTTYNANMTYHYKLNAKHSFKIGSSYSLFNMDMDQSNLSSQDNRISLVDFDKNISTLNNFMTWKYRISEKLDFVGGLHNVNVLFNDKSTLESRMAFNWSINKENIISLGYGEHSTMESIHNYFSKIPQADGSFAETNTDLDLIKARHFVLGYEKRISKNVKAKVEAYYQDLYDIPVENNTNSSYATINEGLEFNYVDLVNEGIGKNYGVELTLERFFNKGFYYLSNVSIFQSKYTALDGIERNTQFNGNYLVNFLIGKEWDGLGKKDNQIFSIDAKAFFGGGRRIIPLLRNDSGDLAVDLEKGEFYDYDKAYESQLDDVATIVLSTSYKWNKKKTTHELFLNLTNVLNSKTRIGEYYDANEPDNIGYHTDFGFIPNMMYRVYF